MDILPRPWRIKFIQQKKGPECVICQKRDNNQDEEEYVLLRSQYSFSFLNIYPYNIGHVLIAPYRHGIEFENLINEELLDMNLQTKKIISALKNSLSPDGFNIGININKSAGAGIVDHLHIHVVPRWEGDTNFFTTIFETRVLGESLKDSFNRIRRYL